MSWISSDSHKNLLTQIYKVEHEVLAPRTREEWGHEWVLCITCNNARRKELGWPPLPTFFRPTSIESILVKK